MNFYISARCLKIPEKVSFNIASEASYGYVLSGKKFNKNVKNRVVKNDPFWRVFESVKLAFEQCYQTGTTFFKRTKMGGKCHY